MGHHVARPAHARVVYLLGAVGCFALYDASEENALLGLGILAAASVLTGLLNDSVVEVLFMPLLTIPISLAFWLPSDGYEPAPAVSIAIVALGPSIFLVWLGGWFRRQIAA